MYSHSYSHSDSDCDSHSSQKKIQTFSSKSTSTLPKKDLFGQQLSKYQTSQSALAAWLYLKGHEVLQVDDSNPRKKSIVFKLTEKLRSDVQAWQTGNAEGNCAQYEQARKSILHMINND